MLLGRCNEKGGDKLKIRTGVKGKLREFFISSPGDTVVYSNIPYPPDKNSEKDLVSPLKNLNPAYREVIKEDTCLNQKGGVNFFKIIARTFISVLPLFNIKVHSYCFDDNKIINKIADLISGS